MDSPAHSDIKHDEKHIEDHRALEANDNDGFDAARDHKLM